MQNTDVNIILTVDQTIRFFSSILDEKLQPILKAIQAAPSNTSPEYITTNQALELLKISKPTLYKLREAGKIEFFKTSENKVLYYRAQIIGYIESRKGGGKQ